MRLLLDTHTFLWFISGSSNLSLTAKTLISDVSNQRFLSVASMWEIAIKVSSGKLRLSQPFDILIPQQMMINIIEKLDIDFSHTSLITTLPYYHRDPFDRMLIAQAITEQLPIISVDPLLDAYAITRIW